MKSSVPSPRAENGTTAVELAPVPPPGLVIDERPAPAIVTFEAVELGSAVMEKNSPTAAWVVRPAASMSVTVYVAAEPAALESVAGVNVADAGAPAVVNETYEEGSPGSTVPLMFVSW